MDTFDYVNFIKSVLLGWRGGVSVTDLVVDYDPVRLQRVHGFVQDNVGVLTEQLKHLVTPALLVIGTGHKALERTNKTRQ